MARDYTQPGKQKDLVEFAVKYPGWHQFSNDTLTVEHVCAAHNLGIVTVNDFGQFRLRSPEKARQWLAARA